MKTEYFEVYALNSKFNTVKFNEFDMAELYAKTLSKQRPNDVITIARCSMHDEIVICYKSAQTCAKMKGTLE